MADDTRVAALVAEWSDRRNRGSHESPDAVIRAHPQLAEALARAFAALGWVDRALAAETAEHVRVPERLGSYRVLDRIGSGGMASVFRAVVEDRVAGVEIGATVALKVIRPRLFATRGVFKRFLREAEAGRRVEHPNVVRTLDADAVEADGATYHFLVMEYVPGGTLRTLLDASGRLSEERCRHFATEIARGLEAIHAAGIVHRDLKPENVLLDRDGQVKLTDLGVAWLADEAMRLSQSGTFVGSLLYAAPEQFGGRTAPDARTDLYALGLVLYEMATGTHPFADGGDFDATSLARRLDVAIRPVREIAGEVSASLEALTGRLLEREPARRPASATELLRALLAGPDAAVE